jgi:ribA/ribD-fused uncharacterized protein
MAAEREKHHQLSQAPDRVVAENDGQPGPRFLSRVRVIGTARIVRSFRGKYFFLSNFSPARFCIDGKWYDTAEHYYQACKADNEADHERVRLATTAAMAKKIGRSIKIRPDWDDVKESVMTRGLRAKFSIPALRSKLLDTGDAELIEETAWHDEFWGVDSKTGKGQNKLGKMLVAIRDELRESAGRAPSSGAMP